MADQDGKDGWRNMQRYYWLLLAERHLTRRRFGASLDPIALVPVRMGEREPPVSRAEFVYPFVGKKSPAKVIADL